MLRLFRFLSLVALLPAVAFAQARQHVIQGRVTSDSGAAIAAADVIVTIAPSAETVLGKTDATGAYRLIIANPTGEYILNISALGFKSFRQRVTIAAGDTIATVNAKLAANVQQVAGGPRASARGRVHSDRSAPTPDRRAPTARTRRSTVSPTRCRRSFRASIDAMASLIPGLARSPAAASRRSASAPTPI